MWYAITLSAILFIWYVVWSHGYWLQPNYIKRWRLIPRNKHFNIYLHKIVGYDQEPFAHDHPWDHYSVVLRGGYDEAMFIFTPHRFDCEDYRLRHRYDGDPYIPRTLYGVLDETYVTRRAGDVVHRWAYEAHRICQTVNNKPAWTLVFTKGDKRHWGFYKQIYYSNDAVQRIKDGKDTEECPGPDLSVHVPFCDHLKDKTWEEEQYT